MKKILVILAIVAVVFGAPYFVGSKAEEHINKMLEIYNQNPSFEVKLISYDRGWFSTKAMYELKLVMPMDQSIPELPTFKVSQDLNHGPILWSYGGPSIGLMDTVEVVQLPEKWIDIQNAIQLTTRTTFDGSTKAKAEIANIDINEQNVLVKVKPAEGEFELTKDGKVTGEFDWQGMEISEGNKAGFNLGAMHFEIDQQLIIGDLYSSNAIFSGTFNATVNEINVSSTMPGAGMSLSNLTIDAASTVTDDVMGVNVAFGIDAVEAMGQKLTDFNYDISIDNLDIASMQELNKMMAVAQDVSLQNQAASIDQLYGNFMAVLPKVLAKKPVLRIDNLGFTAPEGTFSSKLDLTIDETKYDATNPDSLISAMNVESNGQAPEAFFAKFGLGPTIDSLVQQKMITKDADILKFTFQISNGQALLNGNPFPLFEM